MSEAACSGQNNIVQLLIDLGANIDGLLSSSSSSSKKTENIKCPLLRAAWNGHISTMELLLENGANPSLAKWCENASKEGKLLIGEWLDAYPKKTNQKIQIQNANHLLKMEELEASLTEQDQRVIYISKIKLQLKAIIMHGGAQDDDSSKIHNVLMQFIQHEQEDENISATTTKNELVNYTLNTPLDDSQRTLLHLAAWKNKPNIVTYLLTEYLKYSSLLHTTASDQIAIHILHININSRFHFNGSFGW